MMDAKVACSANGIAMPDTLLSNRVAYRNLRHNPEYVARQNG
jgi:hypothetical protein